MMTVTSKYPEDVILAVDEIAQRSNQSRSELLREAVHLLLRQRGRGGSVATRMAHLRGKIKDGPPDLSTNRKHLDTFGT